ncbi:hypothetical protein PCASD_26036 [Puccinia coronata f. sp. avenae]|uniref:Cyanovirin-N domain-containing protein n=1 Tax=Puccinia coronata f. sp. avenae TaxID=200324 RepID=A0A2N5RVE1_9BASI|nr:hypothetical protein PCASD_26036 [Puccinia coronata f. sp. avenae]
MISALIILITLASVPTAVKAESQQRCAIMYLDKSDGGETNQASCTNTDYVTYGCAFDSCHGGVSRDPAKTSPISDFAFTNCRAYDGHGQLTGKADKTVYPYKFHVDRAKHTLDVWGDEVQYSLQTHHYNCNGNKARPYCDRCGPGS